MNPLYRNGGTLRRRRAKQLAVRTPNFRLRAWVLLSSLGLFLLAVIGAAIYRQIWEGDFLQKEGGLRHLRLVEIPARRGMILDRNGEPLAVSAPVASVWANPKQLLPHPQAIQALANVLELSPATLRQRLETHQKRAFLYLKRRIAPAQARKVARIRKQYGIRELGTKTEYQRFYPSGEIFGQILGITDVDERGIEGLELAFDDWLRAEPGLQRVIQDGRHRIIEEVERVRPPQHGKDLVLSLDRRLQFLAYQELMRAVRKYRAKAASAVVLDVASGEILAMVNQPAFNPNAKRGKARASWRNRAVTDVMEPGSTVKPLVAALALEQGVVRPRTPINTSPGILRVGRHRVRDIHNYGRLNTTSVLTKSSNVGIVKIALKMERQALWQFYDRLGFGHATGVEFPGEVRGRLRPFQRWSNFEHATLAFGYGLSVTTLQLARAYSVLASDGILRPLTLLKRDQVPEGERILRARTAQQVRRMLETVVSPEGTAQRAAIPNYRVAGKTGTAKKAVAGGYAKHRYQAVFAGMVPATQPRFVMVVMVDEPQGKYYGGLVAAPVFSKVMADALRLYNVPPDELQKTLLVARRES